MYRFLWFSKVHLQAVSFIYLFIYFANPWAFEVTVLTSVIAPNATFMLTTRCRYSSHCWKGFPTKHDDSSMSSSVTISMSAHCWDLINICKGVSLKLVMFLQFRSVQFSRSVGSDSFRPHESQHARPPYPSPGVHSNSHPSSQWCHPAISSSAIPFSSCPQSLPASDSFPMSQLFAWGGQSIGVSALASFLPKKSQGWSPSQWTGWIPLQSKGLSRVFSNTTVQKHQFFSTQPSSQSTLKSIHDHWKNHSLD